MILLIFIIKKIDPNGKVTECTSGTTTGQRPFGKVSKSTNEPSTSGHPMRTLRHGWNTHLHLEHNKPSPEVLFMVNMKKVLFLFLVVVSPACVRFSESVLSNDMIAESPQLPKTFSVPYELPKSARTIYVKQDNDLQAAFDNANLGDVVMLDAGATFRGNFKLPNKTTGSGWIYIISSDMASLPEGTRVGPSDAAHMPKIISPNSAPALFTVFAAHNYRFAGIEFSTSAAITNLILMGYGLTNYSDPIWRKIAADSLDILPHDITFDRCYLHSTSDSNAARVGICANGRYIAVIDSYLSNFKDTSDAQAILVYNGSGPLKIVNNYLEATGENFMSGGADPAIPGLIPSDIEFKNNYCFKPLCWRETDPSYKGRNWGVKNLFEIKTAQRVLIEGNIFENCWTAAQTGRAIVLKSNPTSLDITFQNNIVRNANGGIDVLAYAARHGQIGNILVRNNLFDLTIHDRAGSFHMVRLYGVEDDAIVCHNVIIDHNTFIDRTNYCSSIGLGDTTKKLNGVRITNNIFSHGTYGVKGSRHLEGQDSLNAFLDDWTFRNNLFVNLGSLALYPSNNFNVGSIAGVGFVDYANGNYKLAPTSSYKNAGTDGKDLGADLAMTSQALRSILEGRPKSGK